MKNKKFADAVSLLFKRFRKEDHSSFVVNQKMYQEYLASFLTDHIDYGLEDIYEALERADLTGKNEVIAKIIFITGGTTDVLPQNIIDAARQIFPTHKENPLVLQPTIKNVWDNMLREYKIKKEHITFI